MSNNNDGLSAVGPLQIADTCKDPVFVLAKAFAPAGRSAVGIATRYRLGIGFVPGGDLLQGQSLTATEVPLAKGSEWIQRKAQRLGVASAIGEAVCRARKRSLLYKAAACAPENNFRQQSPALRLGRLGQGRGVLACAARYSSWSRRGGQSRSGWLA